MNKVKLHINNFIINYQGWGRNVAWTDQILKISDLVLIECHCRLEKETDRKRSFFLFYQYDEVNLYIQKKLKSVHLQKCDEYCQPVVLLLKRFSLARDFALKRVISHEILVLLNLTGTITRRSFLFAVNFIIGRKLIVNWWTAVWGILSRTIKSLIFFTTWNCHCFCILSISKVVNNPNHDCLVFSISFI